MRLKPTKIKHSIREVCINLLNEHGLSNIGMRDLAKAMEMSPGNLTYHYPKWEYLMDEIFEEFQDSMNRLYDFFPSDISEVAAYIDRIYALQMRYAFIFSDFYIFFQHYPKYESVKQSFFPERMQIMRNALQRLIGKSYLYPESNEHPYDLLVKNTWLLLSGWYSFSRMLNDTGYAFTKNEFFLSIWNIYVHHLTPRGKAIVRKSYRELKSKTSS
jgi:AcrR family transcriptional regulator